MRSSLDGTRLQNVALATSAAEITRSMPMAITLAVEERPGDREDPVAGGEGISGGGGVGKTLGAALAATGA